MERRLAAILAVDVVGYSRLMGEDEQGTYNALKARRKSIFDPLISGHRGRLVKLMGDGALVEFSSAISAVECAVAMQKRWLEDNEKTSLAKRIDIRIGINLGDVIADSGDLYGDGVNIAARIQALAPPGGICVSAKVRDEVERKLDLSFDDLGQHELKNIATPVHVFGIAGMGLSPAGQGAVPMTLPNKPSIAVLPFTNMSGDSEQEFFADGLTEDLITELSRFRDLFVISRNSSFKYKGKVVDVQKIARELGVQYVLEGSVRKSGDRVRVTAQLIDAETDRHIWAERYDRKIEDIFAIQDELTSSLAATLPGRVEAAARDRVSRKLPDSLAAYECVLAGKVLHHRSTREDNAKALALLDRAIEIDANYAHAHAWKACTLGQTWVYNWCEDRDATWNKVSEELKIALSLDDNDSDVHRILAALNVTSDDLDAAIYHQERALALNPNDDLIVVQQGEILTWLGRPEEGIEWIKKAMRLNPYHPERFWNHLGRAYFVARRYPEAIEAFRRITTMDQTHHAFLAASHARMNQAGPAAEHRAEVLKRAPDFTIGSYMPTLHYKQDSDRQHHIESLKLAKLPE